MIIKWIFLSLFIIYLKLAATVVIHELAHYFVAKIIGAINIEIVIGTKEIAAIRIGRLTLSPLLIAGSVTCDINKDINWKKIFCFYLAGGISNLIVSILGMIIKDYSLSIINIIMAIISFLPFEKLDNDLGTWVKKHKILRKKRENCIND